MKIHTVIQGSQEWHELRARCHTASELSAARGRSKYMKRSDLIRQKATGLVPEIDANTQRLFDLGHEVEANARALVEAAMGEELYPVVATDDEEYLLASSDGCNMAGTVGFEHKLWNESLAAQVRAGQLDPHYTDQMDQQIAVFGFKKVIFVCSDGTLENFASMDYRGNPESIARIRADWEQFDRDVEAYQHQEPEAKRVGASPENLPALRLEVSGAVTYSNLPQFKAHAMAVIGEIKTELSTDQDFADAEATVKWLKGVEDKLKLAKQQAIEQTESIDELFRAIDEITAQASRTRLDLDKKVKAEKESRKLELVNATTQSMREHCDALAKRIGMPLPTMAVMFGEAIKGLKTLESMRDKLGAALANAKVEANAIADRIEANRKTVEDMSLFHDFAQVCAKSPEDFAALLAMRQGQRNEAEEKRLEAERQRIRAEEEARAKQAAADMLASQQATSEPPATVKQSLTVAAQAEPADTGRTMNLGRINAALGFTVSADFLASLGIHPARQEKAAKLYLESSLPKICSLIQGHLTKVVEALGGENDGSNQ